MARYRIVRDDGCNDSITGVFPSYDAAHAVLERYYGDLCCSDEREYYRIVDDPLVDDSLVDASSLAENADPT